MIIVLTDLINSDNDEWIIFRLEICWCWLFIYCTHALLNASKNVKAGKKKKHERSKWIQWEE